MIGSDSYYLGYAVVRHFHNGLHVLLMFKIRINNISDYIDVRSAQFLIIIDQDCLSKTLTLCF